MLSQRPNPLMMAQNPLAGPQGGPPAGMPPLGGPPMAPGGGMAPGGAMAAPSPSPDEIAEARMHLGAIIDALTSVAAKPRGQLDKQDVFQAAADMLGKGGFPTPESRASLVQTLVGLPTDETALRSEVGRMLLRVAQVRDAFHQVHGTGQPAVNPGSTAAQQPLNAAQLPPGGAPNGGI